MSVLIETSLGDIVVDLHVTRAPIACTNFIKLCKLKAYNYSLFHSITQGFTAQTGGDCTGDLNSGSSVWGLLKMKKDGETINDGIKYFKPEKHKKLKHDKKGVVSFACVDAKGSHGEQESVASSQFFFTLADSGAEYLNGQHAVFGQVVEGLEVLDALNAQLVDDDKRPFRDVRIKHTIILDDPFPDPPELIVPSRSPSPPPQLLASSRIAEDENLFPDIDPAILEKESRDREAAARALTLEMIGDLPFAEIRPPENILFVCKLNPVTRDEDLELIFSRFGEIRSCEIIRDKKTQDSLCYAFIDFEAKESAEEAYFKMDNVLIDDRRIHVDFSQSVSKLHADFLVGNRRGLDDGEFGGKGLQKRRQYRGQDGEDGDAGLASGRKSYDLVFDHDGSTLDREKKRMRKEEESRRGADGGDGGGGGERERLSSSSSSSNNKVDRPNERRRDDGGDRRDRYDDRGGRDRRDYKGDDNRNRDRDRRDDRYKRSSDSRRDERR